MIFSNVCKLSAACLILTCANNALGNIAHGELTIVGSDTVAGDQFGISVAVTNHHMVAGAWLHDGNGDDSGAAYVFDLPSGIERFKLLPDDATADNHFGKSVAASGNIAVASSFFGVYVFDMTTGEQITKLDPPPGYSKLDVRLDKALALNDEFLLVGLQTIGDTNTGPGIVLVYGATNWQYLRSLSPEDGKENDNFGDRVALSGHRAVVSARTHFPAGAAYLFDVTTGEQIHKFEFFEGDNYSDWFGYCVDIEGDRVFVGAPHYDGFGRNAGAFFMFDALTGQHLRTFAPGIISEQIDYEELNYGLGVQVSSRYFAVSSGAFYSTLFDTSTSNRLSAIGDRRANYFMFSMSRDFYCTPYISSNDENGPFAGRVYVTDLRSACLDTDLNGDNITDTADLGMLIAGFGEIDYNQVADINKDNVVDTADLGVLISAFGSSCP